MKTTLQVSKADHELRLDHILAKELPLRLNKPISKSLVRKLIIAGAVYLNGRRVRIASKPVFSGARIDVYIDEKKIVDHPRFQMQPEQILYEDAHLIAINKPAGIPTQPTLDEARDNLYTAAKHYLKLREGGDPYLGLHHRLDLETSGVILFTKTKIVNFSIGELFSKHQVEKIYQALTKKPENASSVGTEWSVENYLGKISRLGKRSRFGSVHSGGDFARTDFKILKVLPSALVIEARPKTGRTHQIRVHLAESGLPVMGDKLYGNVTDKSRLLLHAMSLRFKHPIHGEEILIQSPLPDEFLW